MAKGIDLLKKIAPPTYINKAEEHQKSSNFYLQARLFMRLSGTWDLILIKIIRGCYVKEKKSGWN